MRAKCARIDNGCLAGEFFLRKVEDTALLLDASVYHPP
jgi:hypothetical protein